MSRRRLRPSHIAWTFIVTYEVLAREGELLSNAFDDTKRPWLTRAAIIYTALHCANLLPERLDIYARTADGITVLKPRVATLVTARFATLGLGDSSPAMGSRAAGTGHTGSPVIRVIRRIRPSSASL